jgi:hypothetical protein
LVAIAPQVFSNPPILLLHCLVVSHLVASLPCWLVLPSSSFARRNFELGETSSPANMKESFLLSFFLFVFDLFFVLFWF